MYGFIYGRILGKSCKGNVCELIVYPYKKDEYGVGFTIIVGLKTVATKTIGDSIKLWLYSYLTERESFILGFNSYEIMGVFKKILSVAGIGPRVALNIVDYFETEEKFYAVVKAKDVAQLSRVSGVGKKSALKIIVSLAENIDEVPEENEATFKLKSYKLLQAYLQKLGYKQADIKHMLTAQASSLEKAIAAGASVEQLIKIVLKSSV